MTAGQFAAAVKQAIVDSASKRVAVAELAGISEQSIRSVEAGHCPSVVRADLLLSALGKRLVIGDPNGTDLAVPASKPKRKRVRRG